MIPLRAACFPRYAGHLSKAGETVVPPTPQPTISSEKLQKFGAIFTLPHQNLLITKAVERNPYSSCRLILGTYMTELQK